MDYELFGHPADIGIRGFGETVEQAFENGAKALFQVMTDIKSVEPKTEIEIKTEAGGIEELFVEWLNELLSQADLEDMFFSEFELEIKKNKDYRLEGKVRGEKMDSEKHELKTVVKAATYSQLKVEKTNKKFLAQCICDI